MVFVVILLADVKSAENFAFVDTNTFFSRIFFGPISAFWKLWTKTLKLWSKIKKSLFSKQVLEFYFTPFVLFCLLNCLYRCTLKHSDTLNVCYVKLNIRSEKLTEYIVKIERIKEI